MKFNILNIPLLLGVVLLISACRNSGDKDDSGQSKGDCSYGNLQGVVRPSEICDATMYFDKIERSHGGFTSTNKDIVVRGKIDDHCTLSMHAPNGNFTVIGKVDGSSRLEVTAKGAADFGDKIDGGSVVTATCGGRFLLFNQIDGGSNVTITAGTVEIRGKIDNGATTVFIKSQSDIHINGKIDGSCRVDLYSEHGKIYVGEAKNSGTVIRWHTNDRVGNPINIRGENTATLIYY